MKYSRVKFAGITYNIGMRLDSASELDCYDNVLIIVKNPQLISQANAIVISEDDDALLSADFIEKYDSHLH